MSLKNGRRKRKQRMKQQLQDSLGQVLLVKNDHPIPKDVVKAAAKVNGHNITYNQGYCAIKAKDSSVHVADMESYELIVPYLKKFEENNPGAELHYKVVDGKIESLFVAVCMSCYVSRCNVFKIKIKRNTISCNCENWIK
jgi:hypothetical protein